MEDKKVTVQFGLANAILLISMFWHPKSTIGEIIYAVMFLAMLVSFVIDILIRNRR
ncbi:hypothetical protein [Lactobacillus intestinalis]|uniref:hypothetical protein n=1 Tax=Lactobacillus intestinalis TaxID=151781 RepID=UPI000B1CBAAA|nr:hypothetical protein [Lactobacillus intestinalis]UTW40702.1 hypothetical protein KBW87_02060 [Lactobacillus intestinalis]